MTTLLWFGRDLRLADNPALAAAIERGAPILPVFILDDEEAGERSDARLSTLPPPLWRGPIERQGLPINMDVAT